MCNATTSYTVAGMTCNGCVNKVAGEVTKVEGVVDVDVDVSNGTLQVTGHVDDAAVRAAVAHAGYSVVSA